MAVILITLLATFWFFISTAATEQNCSIVRCKVLPVGESIASEFKPKASEEGVRMIYLNLKIGNNSYNPLELQDEFQPDRWVWARSNNEPMLSLPYDFDILSLGLLNYQVGSMTVPLRDEPSGCLAGLNSTCQNMVVGRALLDNVTSKSGNNGVVCVAMIDEDVHNSDARSIVYHCCRLNTSSINCNLSVEARMSFQVINAFLLLLSVVVMLYSPAMLLMLPEYIFDLQYECDKESNTENNELQVQNGKEDTLKSFDPEEIPVDDTSPITCSVFLLGHFQRLPNLPLSFNLKLAFLLFIVLPFGFYIKLGLFFLLKQKYFNEYVLKVPDQETVTSLYRLYSIPFFFTYPFYFSADSISKLVTLTFTCLMAALFLRPKDLFLNRQPTKCILCSLAASYVSCATENENSVSIQSIGENMLQHLKVISKEAHPLTLKFLDHSNSGLKNLVTFSTCFSKVNHNGSRMRRALCMLWLLSSSLVTLFLAGILWVIFCLILLFIFLLATLLIFSPVVILFIFGVEKILIKISAITSNSTVVKRIVYFFTLPCIIAYIVFLIFGLFLLLFSLCTLFFGTFGFTIMGLVLNVEIVTPYVAFFVVVTTNIYFCYANLQKGYIEVKGFIFKYWQQELQTTRSNEQRTMPAKLFWFVSDKVLPIQKEICLMLRNTAAIVTFLFLTMSSIIFFGHEYEISTLVSTIAVFISGAIPSLFFKGLTRGKKFAGWEKIKLKREIEAVVREYLEHGTNKETEESSSCRSDDDSVV